MTIAFLALAVLTVIAASKPRPFAEARRVLRSRSRVWRW